MSVATAKLVPCPMKTPSPMMSVGVPLEAAAMLMRPETRMFDPSSIRGVPLMYGTRSTAMLSPYVAHCARNTGVATIERRPHSKASRA